MCPPKPLGELIPFEASFAVRFWKMNDNFNTNSWLPAAQRFSIDVDVVPRSKGRVTKRALFWKDVLQIRSGKVAKLLTKRGTVKRMHTSEKNTHVHLVLERR